MHRQQRRRNVLLFESLQLLAFLVVCVPCRILGIDSDPRAGSCCPRDHASTATATTTTVVIIVVFIVAKQRLLALLCVHV